MTHRLHVLLNILLGAVLVTVVVLAARDLSQNQSKGPAKGQPTLPMVTIHIDGKPLEVEVADDPREQEMGYMFRDPPEKTGMLFVYPDAWTRGYWMKNTRFDIDLAYIDASGRVFQVERMVKFDERTVRSRGPAQYVLELPAGRFAELGLKVGSQITFPPELTGDAPGVVE